MAMTFGRFRFYAVKKVPEEGRRSSGEERSSGRLRTFRVSRSGFHLRFQEGLQALLHGFVQPNEFYAHAHPGIAGADQSGGGDFLGFNPEDENQLCARGEWNPRLHIAATSAYVRGGGLHGRASMLISQLNRKRDLEPGKLPLVAARGSGGTGFGLHRFILREILPRTFLPAKEFYIGIEKLRKARVPDAHNPEPRLLVAVLHPDHVLSLQRM